MITENVNKSNSDAQNVKSTNCTATQWQPGEYYYF